MTRTRRLLGKETIVFVDGEEKEVEFYAVPNFKILQLKRLYRKNIKVKEGGKTLDDIVFHDDEFIKAILKLSSGNQISEEDWTDGIETDYTKLYNKFFDNNSTEEQNQKKDNCSDTSTPNPDKELK